MRTIKFRGKCIDETTDNGKWIVGSLLQDDNGIFMIVCFVDHHEQWYRVDPDTVGQYTGMDDKNGKEIHEGDIVKTPLLDPIFGDVISNAFDYAPVCFANGAFAVAYHEGRHKIYLQDLYDKVEVVGNIHDNPELMEGGGE